MNTRELAERIITQMLYSEMIFQEEEVFEDYYVGKPYFRLKQAYLAYVSYQYVIWNREISKNIFAIIMKELQEKEYLADICKAAILKYFVRIKVDQNIAFVLQKYLRELCEKKMIFAFYQEYPKQWLREMQLYDKKILEYRAKKDGKVKIFYRLNQEELKVEMLMPSYENTYVKEFILFAGDCLEYYFQEETKEAMILTSREVVKQGAAVNFEGRYGRLNQMIQAPAEAQMTYMLKYRSEEELAKEMFPAY